MKEEKANYLETRISMFEGLNSFVAPELIKETEARQLLNLRPERLGKLSTRPGYQFGVYLYLTENWTALDLETDKVRPDVTTTFPVDTGYPSGTFTPENIKHNLYPYNLGIYWIGEYKLDAYWPEVDTDKFMVYAIVGNCWDEELYIPGASGYSDKARRILDWLSDNGYILPISGSSQYKINFSNPAWQWGINSIEEFRLPIQYLFVPLTGQYRNIILDPYYLHDMTDNKSGATCWLSQDNWYNPNRPRNPGIEMYIRPFDWARGKRVLRSPHRFWNTDEYYFNKLEITLDNFFRNAFSGYSEGQFTLQDVLRDDVFRHFGQANQYRNHLVISDPINGDQLVSDLYDFSDPGCDKFPHTLLIRPNCLESFDVDIVEIDPRLNEGEENDITKGVETGMGLYGFELPTRITKGVRDYFDPTLTDRNFLLAATPEDEDRPLNKKFREPKVMHYMLSRESTTLLTAVTRSCFWGTRYSDVDENLSALPDKPFDIVPGIPILLPTEETRVRYSFIVNINNTYPRIFSNIRDQVEFVDLLGEVEFPEDTVVDTSDPNKTVTKKEKACDVFIWEDFKLTYYPTKGTDGNGVYPYLFRDKDREFDKILPKVPRVVSFDKKEGAAENAPLAMWFYRFVWDFGNGIYSAPSTVLSAPDIMWSAIPDSEMNDENNKYRRPFRFHDAPMGEWDPDRNYWIKPKDDNFTINFLPKPTSNNPSLNLPAFDDSFHKEQSWLKPYQSLAVNKVSGIESLSNIQLTYYGKLLWKLKHKLYNGINARYSNIVLYNDASESDLPESILQRGTALIDFPVLVTGYFGDHTAILDGIAWQFVKLDFEKWVGNKDYISNKLSAEFGNIVIPLFQREGIGRSRFSLFDHENRLRISYLVKNKYSNDSEYLRPHIFWAAPWRVQSSPYKETCAWFVSGYPWSMVDYYKVFDIVLAREPFEDWMYLYLMFYCEWDFNNLPARYFTSSHSNKIYVNHYAKPYEYSIMQSSGFNISDPFYIAQPMDYYSQYICRPTNYIRGLHSQSDTNSLAVAGSDIPNEVYSRLIKTGTIELKLVDNSDWVAPWFAGQEFISYFGPASFADSRESRSDNNNRRDRYDPPDSFIYKQTRLVQVGNDKYGDANATLLRNIRERNIFNPYIIREYYSEDIYVTHIVDIDANGNKTIQGYICNAPVYEISLIGAVPVIYEKSQPDDEADLTLISYSGVSLPGHFKLFTEYKLYVLNYYEYTPILYNPPGFPDWRDYYNEACFHNIEVYLYGEGHRLLAPEQLSAHFPTGLLFKSPRLALKIKSEYVPRLAKKLLVFRSRYALDNAFNPVEFGLAKEVEILRRENGDPYTIVETKTATGDIQKTEYSGIYFFDDVTIDKVDFSIKPEDFEGLRNPLYSRFNVALNERVYYYNFLELYRPEKVRKNETQLSGYHHPNIPSEVENTFYTSGSIIPSFIAYAIKDDTEIENGFAGNSDQGTTYQITYNIAAEDRLSKIGEPATFTIKFTVPQNERYVVVMALLPNPYDDSIEKISIFRRIDLPESEADTQFYYIGSIKPSAEGIFVDDNKKKQAAMPCWDYERRYFPTGLRWSEPYRPDWIKIDSWTEYKGGLAGTGLAENYGNLVLFSEKSMGRYTVQAVDPPISRVDELSPNIGCIAPNSIIDYKNTLFFLSSQGWTYYDNNVFKNIDEPFAHEILYLTKHLPIHSIYYSTGGIHQNLNEIYLNMPTRRAEDSSVFVQYIFDDYRPDTPYVINSEMFMLYYTHGDFERFGKNQKIWGNVFVRNPQYQYATKYGYIATEFDYISEPISYGYGIQYYRYFKKQFLETGNIRLYHTNSLGELRSADISPNIYPVGEYYAPYYWAGIYIESISPTLIGNSQPAYKVYNDYNDYSWHNVTEIDDDVIPQLPDTIRWLGRLIESFELDLSEYQFNYFPKPYYLPIKWLYFSKFFNDEDETGLKRLRKGDANLYNRGVAVVRNVVIHREEEMNYIEEYNLNKPNQNVFIYNPIGSYYYHKYNTFFSGRGQSVLSFIPQYLYTFEELTGELANVDDWNTKPVKTSIEIYGVKRATISEIGFYWRYIHRYLF